MTPANTTTAFHTHPHSASAPQRFHSCFPPGFPCAVRECVVKRQPRFTMHQLIPYAELKQQSHSKVTGWFFFSLDWSLRTGTPSLRSRSAEKDTGGDEDFKQNKGYKVSNTCKVAPQANVTFCPGCWRPCLSQAGTLARWKQPSQ